MNLSLSFGVAILSAIRCSPPVSSEVSPKKTVAPSSTSRSTVTPTVGQDPSPVVVSFYGERRDGFAGLGDAVGDLPRPVLLYPDHHGSGDVGIGADADHSPEVQLQILTVLQPTIGVRQR